jgi:hypothetical protein
MQGAAVVGAEVLEGEDLLPGVEEENRPPVLRPPDHQAAVLELLEVSYWGPRGKCIRGKPSLPP